MKQPVKTSTEPAGGLRWLLGPLAVAVLCSGILTATHLLTIDAIAANEQQQSLRALKRLLDNTPAAARLTDVDWTGQTERLCLPGILVSRSVSQGYAGPINLLTAISLTQPAQLAGITVTGHQETPGIADFLNDESAGGWLAGLRSASAATIAEVDTVSGATISSRALLNTLTELLRQAPEQGCTP